MSEDDHNPLEAILRLCADAAPGPWYPRLYAKQTGADRHVLALCLEELSLEGLIRKEAGTGETGPAISLTDEGERVLLDPEALQRLRSGEPLSPGNRGTIIRQALRERSRPFVTVLLVLLNVVVFAGGWYVARQHGIDSEFLRGDQRVRAVHQLIERSGSVTAYKLIDGEWWRLLTAGFVHIGFLHLLLNMVFLYMAGRFMEQLWGHIRYLVIYLAGVLGGCSLAVAHNVGGGAGASGAVCGLIGAEAVWFLFNRKYLPRSLMRQAITGLIINGILLVFISSFKNVGAWGHFGGAAFGASAALLLHLHRFGPPGARWLAIVGFVPLAWYSYFAIDHARATEESWHTVERKQFATRYHKLTREAMDQADKVYKDEAAPLLVSHPTRRDPAALETALPILVEQQRQLRDLAERLARAGPYYDESAEDARQLSRETIDAEAERFALAEDVLRRGDPETGKDREALRQQEEKLSALREKWDDLFER